LEEGECYYVGCDKGADALVWHAPNLETLQFQDLRSFNDDLEFRYREKRGRNG
jgi:hypothetical protein